MPLELQPFNTSRMEEAMRLQRLSFYDPNGMSALFTSGPDFTNDQELQSRISLRKAMWEKAGADRLFVFQVVDTDANDKIVGFAVWEVDRTFRTPEQLKSSSDSGPPPAGANAQAWDDFHAYLTKARTEVLGLEPAVFLKSLCTHPEYRRKGVGAMCMKWGAEKADELGLRGYVEATDAGQRLYERFGFVKLYETTFHLEKYGGSGTETNVVMIRPAKGKMDSAEEV